MLTLGAGEMFVIFIVALVLFGPKKLPELGRTIGKAMTEFRRASSDLKATFEREMHTMDQEARQIQQETQKTVSELDLEGRQIQQTASELADDPAYNYGLPSAEEVWNPLDYESRASGQESAAIAPPAESTSEYAGEGEIDPLQAAVESAGRTESSMPAIIAANDGTVPRTSAFSSQTATSLAEAEPDELARAGVSSPEKNT